MLVKLTIAVNPEAEEAIAQALLDESPGGLAIEDAAGEVLISAFLEADRVDSARRELHERVARLRDAGLDAGRARISVEAVEERKWEIVYREHFHVTKIGNIVVKPTWEVYEPSGDERVILLDPGLAFGTGSHPTTKGCLIALQKHVRSGDRVLDIGTGSGILAIAAAKLGAEYVLAVDSDPVAIAVARSNVSSNQVDDRVDLKAGGVERAEGGRFDIAVANLTVRDIIDLLPKLSQTRGIRVVVLSGMLTDQGSRVEKALESLGLRFTDELHQDGWLTVVAAVNHPSSEH